MKNKIQKIILLTLILLTQISWARVDYCNRESFTQNQLQTISGGPIKKILNQYSELEAQSIVEMIEKNALRESNSIRTICSEETQSCFGQDNDWTYQKEKIRDAFKNNLRLNGSIVSKKFDQWPANDFYYAQQTQIGYTCSWGGSLQTICEKWCSITVVDDRFRD